MVVGLPSMAQKFGQTAEVTIVERQEGQDFELFTLKFLKARNGIKIHKICSSLLFSVYIAADRNWNVVATGPSLSRVMGETVIGEKLDSLFHMSRPLTLILKIITLSIPTF